MRRRRHGVRDRQRRDLLPRHGVVAREPTVLGRHLPGAVLEPPRRIGQHRAERHAIQTVEPRHVASVPADRRVIRDPGQGRRECNRPKGGPVADYDVLRLAEMASISEYLHELDDEQWDEASLCDGWRVRDVISHMCVGYTTPMPVAAGQDREEGASASPRPHETSRSPSAAPTGPTPSSPPSTTSARRTSGRASPRSSSPTRRSSTTSSTTRTSAGRSAGPGSCRRTGWSRRSRSCPASGGFVGAKKRVAGLRLVATDVDWSHGGGPEVAGPGEAILLAASGRPVALAELRRRGRRRCCVSVWRPDPIVSLTTHARPGATAPPGPADPLSARTVARYDRARASRGGMRSTRCFGFAPTTSSWPPGWSRPTRPRWPTPTSARRVSCTGWPGGCSATTRWPRRSPRRCSSTSGSTRRGSTRHAAACGPGSACSPTAAASIGCGPRRAGPGVKRAWRRSAR